MSLRNRIPLVIVAWLALISGLHAYLNVNWSSMLNDSLPEDKRRLNVGYIPVT